MTHCTKGNACCRMRWKGHNWRCERKGKGVRKGHACGMKRAEKTMKQRHKEGHACGMKRGKERALSAVRE